MFGTTSGSALWSALQPGGNPLVRPSDRRQARLAAVLIALALISGPLMAAYGFSYHTSLTERADAQQQNRHYVDAVLTEDAPAVQQSGASALEAQRTATVLAEWSTPDGRLHEGVIPVAGGMSAGETVSLWVDGDGTRTTAPLSTAQAASAAVLATIGIWLVFVAALSGVYVLTRIRLDRERYAAWEREWRELDEHRT